MCDESFPGTAGVVYIFFFFSLTGKHIELSYILFEDFIEDVI